jgi:uncharacterized protein DUF4265
MPFQDAKEETWNHRTLNLHVLIATPQKVGEITRLILRQVIQAPGHHYIGLQIAGMKLESKIITHGNPIWRSKSNFIIKAEFALDDERYSFEQLWARDLGNDRFELCCIPFFTYGLALGDVVNTSQEPGRKYVFDKLVSKSGRSVIRVWFGDCELDNEAAHFVEDMKENDFGFEINSANLVAVDLANDRQTMDLRELLNSKWIPKGVSWEYGNGDFND